ncbi:FUSC family protein [Aquisalimonas sp.]|uniref:FUSC family protein n=1 Tax=Aquisalimonas sp. TaxID=1872621 RepID=UPI0025C63832|nr:FUSC family protein [Aquisalimonas sp.]
MTTRGQWVRAHLTDRGALAFATRTLIAMALAMAAATMFELEHPYWALISAVFLQIRPETGFVIEKGIWQILGTLAGGAVGVAILMFLMPYPALAVMALAIWVGANATASALLRRLNVVYGFAIAGVTAVIVVTLTMLDAPAADGGAVFRIAEERVSEIIVGAVCATLAASVLWPVRVKQALMDLARSGINELFDYLDLELTAESSGDQRHRSADTVLQTIVALSDDASAALFEGPEGPGRTRAVSRLCQKALALMATVQVFGRFRRRHPELVGSELDAALDRLRQGIQQMRATNSEARARRIAQALRRELQETPAEGGKTTPVQRMLFRLMRMMVGDLIVVLRANHAIETSDRALLKAPALAPYRDPLIGAVTGGRTTLLFLIGAGAWLASGSPATVVLMILPVIFSIMFARLPSPPAAMRRLLVGALIAVPVAWAVALGLMAQVPQGLAPAMAIFGVPMFVGLMAISDPDTRHYGIGFVIPYILLIQPGGDMTFVAGEFARMSLAILVSLALVYLVFRLINEPGARIMRRRLVASTARDIQRLGEPHRAEGEDWFDARMAERLMRLSAYDRSLPERERHLTDLGLTGLNLGHSALRLQRQLADDDSPEVRTTARKWQRSLAHAYRRASRGRQTSAFRQRSAHLLSALVDSGNIDADGRALIEGALERLALTLERLAKTVPSASSSR